MSLEVTSIAPNNVQKFNNNTQTPIENSKKPEEKSNGKTLLIGSLAALAVGAGIYLATKGKKGNVKSGSETINETDKPIKQLKETAIDAFKKAGNKFEKGKAILANGESYTGRLTHARKDGSTLVMEYENGLLKESTILDNYSILSGKNYTYDSNNKLTKVDDIFDKELVKIKRDETTGKILGNGRQNFIYSLEDGSLRYIDNGKFQNQSGETLEGFVELYPNSNKIKRATADPSIGIVFHFDEKGNSIISNKTKNLKVSYQCNEISDQKLTFKDGYWHFSAEDKNRCLQMHDCNSKTITEIMFDNDSPAIYVSKHNRSNNTKKSLDINNYRKGESVITIGKEECARYNIHTKELEILPESKYSKEEILETIKELTDDAKLILSKRKEIRSLEKPAREFNKTAEQLLATGSGVNKHFV